MAATIRLTALAVEGIGDFGRAVADRLIVAGARPASTEWDGVEALAVVSWRPEPTDTYAQRASTHGIPWYGVFIDHPHVIAGPWVEPAGGGCHECYRLRRRQHDTAADTRQAILDAYAADSGLGVYGHLPQHVRFAEAAIRNAIATRRTGYVTTWPLTGGTPLTTHLVPRHGCKTCRATTWGDPRLSQLIDGLTAGGAA